jgi:hypothetical protein
MKINILKPITLKWWQVGVFKIAALALGISIGAYWSGIFSGSIKILITIFIIGWIYLARIWFKNWNNEG